MLAFGQVKIKFHQCKEMFAQGLVGKVLFTCLWADSYNEPLQEATEGRVGGEVKAENSLEVSDITGRYKT